MEKRNAKSLSYILFAFVLFIVFFYMLNESKRKEEFSKNLDYGQQYNEALFTSIYIILGCIVFFFLIGAFLTAVYGSI
jgi:hypothetical protein